MQLHAESSIIYDTMSGFSRYMSVLFGWPRSNGKITVRPETGATTLHSLIIFPATAPR